jgi:hypothetical protein
LEEGQNGAQKKKNIEELFNTLRAESVSSGGQGWNFDGLNRGLIFNCPLILLGMVQKHGLDQEKISE